VASWLTSNWPTALGDLKARSLSELPEVNQLSLTRSCRRAMCITRSITSAV